MSREEELAMWFKPISEMTQLEKEKIQAHSVALLKAHDAKYNVTIGDDGIARYPSGKLRQSTLSGGQYPLGSKGF